MIQSTLQAARLFSLAAFFISTFSASALASETEKAPEYSLTTSYWIDSFDFFQSEQDTPSLEALRTKAIEKQYSNLPVVKKVLDSIVIAKDRALLVETMATLSRKNSCLHPESIGSSPSLLCKSLEDIWNAHLAAIYFYEDSASKIERARRFLENKECDKALTLLKESAIKEGLNYQVVEYLHEAYTCLGDDGNRVAKEAELQKLKVFINYSQ